MNYLDFCHKVDRLIKQGNTCLIQKIDPVVQLSLSNLHSIIEAASTTPGYTLVFCEAISEQGESTLTVSITNNFDQPAGNTNYEGIYTILIIR